MLAQNRRQASEAASQTSIFVQSHRLLLAFLKTVVATIAAPAAPARAIPQKRLVGIKVSPFSADVYSFEDLNLKLAIHECFWLTKDEVQIRIQDSGLIRIDCLDRFHF